MENHDYVVLLYYKYVDIKNPDLLMKEQRLLCESLNLKGRILIANEGINGTLEGKKEDTDTYMHAMHNLPLFTDLHFKKSSGTKDGSAFRKLVVRVRPEVVTAGVKDLNPLQLTGKYISADQLHTWFEEKKEFYIVDMRNDYEFASGHFEGSIASGMNHFFELEQTIPQLTALKNKTIVTVCTGGIRCEKASGFLLANGFSDVYQLKDGIHTYMETYPNQHFKGKLYVFDKRILIGFHTDSPSHEIVGSCILCGKKSEHYQNCAYTECNKHYILCEECLDVQSKLAFCNTSCKERYLQITSNQ